MGDISIHAVQHSDVSNGCTVTRPAHQLASLMQTTAVASSRTATSSPQLLVLLRATAAHTTLYPQSTASFGSSASDWGPEEHVSDLGIRIQPGTPLYQISVEELHPTQLCVGMQQVLTYLPLIYMSVPCGVA